MSYARIARGQMAADVLQRDFTQIHNRLFRDKRLSFKAKGIFGLISTHRDGYGVTPEWIAAEGTDGPAAVRTGLRELEKYGYLVRHQERNPDGTMGQMTYSITDMPSSEPVSENQQAVPTCEDSENRRSEPVSDFPHADEPQAADRAHKKTSTKKTTEENTNRPSVPEQRANEGEEGGTDGGAPQVEVSNHEGVELLLAIGAEHPEFLLTGKPLRDQGLLVAGMLAEGWEPEHLRQVVVGRPLPSPIRTTIGAIVSSRLRAALAGPVPRRGSGTHADREQPTHTPEAWTEDLIVVGDRPGECEGQDGMCGRPTLGEARLCPSCLSDGAFV